MERLPRYHLRLRRAGRPQEDGRRLRPPARPGLTSPRGNRRLRHDHLELLELDDWLVAEGVTIAMESDRVYWKPIYHILESTSLYCW